MKHNIKKLEPAKLITVVDFTACDICERPNKSRKVGIDTCDLSYVDIRFQDVESDYPECQSGETYTYDICEDCFKEKVMPALEGLGALPTITKYHY